MLTSKQVMQATGISRATLHNYIALGMLPKPIVKNPGLKGRGARQLGYFPQEVIGIIEQIKQLKGEGWSMLEISKRLAVSQNKTLAPGNAEDLSILNNPQERSFGEIAPVETKTNRGLHLTIDQIPHPAYMLNYNLEVTWCNDQARENLLSDFTQLTGNIPARNIFQMLAESSLCKTIESCNEMLRFHIGLAKARLTHDSFDSLLANIPPEKRQQLQSLYADVEAIPAQSILETTINLYKNHPVKEPQAFNVYASFYREGILFVYVPGGPASDSLLELLARRDDVIRKLLRKRLPAITQLAVMVANLQDSNKICSALPPGEYFELINQIWATMGPIFRKYYGVHGKHVGDGMVYYFFPQPDSSYIFNALQCAQEVKFAMGQISKQWQLRKGWGYELYLNTGINEGQEWLGTFQGNTNVEFTVLGETINQAARLGDLARCGGIWASKNFLCQLSTEERKRVRFGIHRKNEEGMNVFISSTYSVVSSLFNEAGSANHKLSDISELSVAEIIEVNIPLNH